jgi:CrcB protein
LTVNLVGSLAMGLLAGWLARHRENTEPLRLLLGVGLLGGFTTFSAFSVESLVLLQRGEWILALGHTLAHVVGALACAVLGFRLAAVLLAR